MRIASPRGRIPTYIVRRASLALARGVSHPAAPLPTRVFVGAVVFAPIDVLGAAPTTFDSVRAAVRVGFAHARELRLGAASGLVVATFEVQPVDLRVRRY